MPTYDFLVVGAGLFGSSFARAMADNGKSVLLIDKKKHLMGSAHSEVVEGIDVHSYGPHIFHTNSSRIWDFMCRFGEFDRYYHRGRLHHSGKLYSFPINLFTLNQLYGVMSPAEAEKKLAEMREDVAGDNLEAWCLRNLGRDLYERFVRNYTTKQWGRPPSELPSVIIKRIPIRLENNDQYFDDIYQGVPTSGWAQLGDRMIDSRRITLKLGVDFLADRKQLQESAAMTIYSGSPDLLFDADLGMLEYRSLRFEREVLPGDFQGCAIVHYPEAKYPFTRIVEYRHFLRKYQQLKHTVIVREFPQAYDRDHEGFYPVNTEVNDQLARKYIERAEASGILCGGRSGTYQYRNMDQVVGQALAVADKLLTDPSFLRRFQPALGTAN